MRFLNFLLTICVFGFEAKDHTIFDLQDSLTKIFPNSNFYLILNISKTATTKQIIKAFRQLSLQYHPDKNSTAQAAELYKILTPVSEILRDRSQRERYDKHLDRGFPTWRGTGYYYTKFQPGLIFTLLFLLIAISFAQYAIQWVFYFRELKAMVILKAEDEADQVVQRLKREKKSKKNRMYVEGEIIVYDYSVDRPTISDLLIFALPRMMFRLLRSVLPKLTPT